MNDPLEIFEAAYMEWRPPERTVPKWNFYFWPALAGGATLLALFISQASPVGDNREQPSAILVEQVSEVDTVATSR